MARGQFRGISLLVDLSKQQERQAIWRIQIAKFRRQPENFDIVQLARATDGLTGWDIKQLFIDALHKAFSRRQEPTDLSIAILLNDPVPLSNLMRKQVTDLRYWAKGCARRTT